MNLPERKISFMKSNQICGGEWGSVSYFGKYIFCCKKMAIDCGVKLD
jgi:hypothetical protein